MGAGMSILKIRDENGNVVEIKVLRGHTPVKGVDYWTPADKQEIVEDVLAALPVAEGVGF